MFSSESNSAPSLLTITPERLAIAALCAVVLWLAYQLQGGRQPAAPVTPAAGDGPNLVAVFATNPDRAEAAAHAKAFGAICRTVAEIVEKDPQHRIKTGRALEELRTATREYRLAAFTDPHLQLASQSFATKYPTLGPTVGNYLDSAAGKSGKKLDEATRAAWVKAFRTLAHNSDLAAE